MFINTAAVGYTAAEKVVHGLILNHRSFPLSRSPIPT